MPLTVGLILVPVGWLLGKIAEEGDGFKDGLVVLVSFLLYAFGIHFVFSKSGIYLLATGSGWTDGMKLLAPLMVGFIMTIVYVRSWLPFITSQFANMLLQKPSGKPKSGYDLAESAYWRGQIDQAIRLLEEGASKHSKDPYPLRRLSELLVERGEYARAAEALKEASHRTKETQEWADLSFRLADLLDRHMKRREEALELLERVISKHPEKPCAEQARMRRRRILQGDIEGKADSEEI